jgi:hypothetical protein
MGMTYDGSWTVERARDEYLAANGFALADYDKRWVRLQVGPIPVFFPNTAARRKAVPLHDLHHVATGYATTWRGEAEISAWELGAGCGRFFAAWILDLGGAAVGMLIAPRRTWRAFRRGRRSRTLYKRGWSDEQLGMTVAELRRELALE